MTDVSRPQTDRELLLQVAADVANIRQALDARQESDARVDGRLSKLEWRQAALTGGLVLASALFGGLPVLLRLLPR